LVPQILGALFFSAAGLAAFAHLAEEMGEGDTHAFDNAILMMLRAQGDPALPLGPRWLVDAARDITALGSAPVLALVIAAATVLLAVARYYRSAVFVAVSALSGTALTISLKGWFGRPRPEFVAHDLYISGASFPSGHATMSAVVYLTLGTLLTRFVEGTGMRIAVLTLAAALSGLVGMTRIYLGVHWPTDVLAGWALGSAWALGCWALAEIIGLHVSDGRRHTNR